MLLLIWWVGPFLLNHAYMTDMKYGKRPQGADDSFWDMFFPLTPPLDILITSLAVIGFGAAVMRRHLTGSALGVIGLVFVAGVYLDPGQPARDRPAVEPAPAAVRLPRPLPVDDVGAVEVLTIVVEPDHRPPGVGARRPSGRRPRSPGSPRSSCWSIARLDVPGAAERRQRGSRTATRPYTRGARSAATETNADALGDGWARYNFAGYEGRNEYYTEYEDVVRTMERLGQDPAHGCGRAMWENNEDNGKYGTTMALMLLPHWTDGCIGSMEGLFFEASGTTPYHFLTVAAMSKQSSNPVRELRYENNNAAIGVREMQALGVRYAMVRTPEAKTAGGRQPELVLVASSGRGRSTRSPTRTSS